MPIRYRKDFEAERLNKCPQELHNKLRNPRCRMETYEKEQFNPINPPPVGPDKPVPDKPVNPPIAPRPDDPGSVGIPYNTSISPLVGAGAGLVGAGGTLLGRRQLGRAVRNMTPSDAEREGYRRVPTSERGVRVQPDPRSTTEFPDEEPRAGVRTTSLEGDPDEVRPRTLNQDALRRAQASRRPVQQAEGEGTEMTETRPSPLEDPEQPPAQAEEGALEEGAEPGEAVAEESAMTGIEEEGIFAGETSALVGAGTETAEAGAEVAGSEGFVNPIADIAGAGLVVGGAVLSILGAFGVGEKTPTFNGIQNAQELTKSQLGSLIGKVSNQQVYNDLQSIYENYDQVTHRAVVSYKDAQGNTQLGVQLTPSQTSQAILAYQKNPNVYKGYTQTQLALMGLNPAMAGGTANAIKMPNGDYVPKTNDLTGSAYDPDTNLLSNYYSKAIYGDNIKLNQAGKVQSVSGDVALTQSDLTEDANPHQPTTGASKQTIIDVAGAIGSVIKGVETDVSKVETAVTSVIKTPSSSSVSSSVAPASSSSASGAVSAPIPTTGASKQVVPSPTLTSSQQANVNTFLSDIQATTKAPPIPAN